MHLAGRMLGVAVLLVGAVGAMAEDWPQWRGPRGDGISKETLPESLGASPKRVWEVKVGQGYACPIAVKDTVYIFMADGKQEGLMAFAASDGKSLWKKAYDSEKISDGGYKGTRATPVYEDGKIYTLGGGGQVTCFDANDSGKILWQTNVLSENKAKNLNWGTASSPLLVGDRIYVQVGNGGPLAVGLNKNTGKTEWKTEERGLSGYAHPILIDVEGVKQLIVFGGKAVYGVAFDSGKTLWQQGWETAYDVNAATPLYRDGNLLVSSGYGHGAMMLKLGKDGATKVWEKKELASKFPGMILDGDYVYGNSEGKLTCLHWPEGAVAWAEKSSLNAGGTLVKAGDKLLVTSEVGRMYLYKTDGKTRQKLGETEKLFDAKDVWSTPLLYGGKVYYKGAEDLVCFDLNAK